LPTKIEIQISFLLNQNKPINEVVSSCLESLHDGALTKGQQNSYLYFALNSGAKKEVLRTLREWPNKEKYFPWGFFLDALVFCGENISDDEFDSLYNYFTVNGKTPFVSPAHVQLNKKFKLKVNELRDSLAYESSKKIKLLWDKLNFIQGKNIVDEEVKVLDKLRVFDPENPELVTHLARIDKKIAIDLFSRPKQSHFEIDHEQYTKTQLSKIDLESCKAIFEKIKEETHDGDQKYYDYTVLFYQLEAYSFALACIQLAPARVERDWFLIELLFLSKRYFECIDLADRLYADYQDHPEIQFASLYQKAQALWKIGTHNEALEVMTAIVNSRPGYRSAYEILHSWRQEIS